MKIAFAVLGRVRWGSRWGGVHHLARELARRHPVRYLELPATPGRRLLIHRRVVAGEIPALTEPDWPLRRFGGIRRWRARRLAAALRRGLPADRAVVALLHARADLDVVRALRPDLTVYRATDDFSESEEYRAWEREALAASGLALAVSRPLADRLGAKALYLPNGVDDAVFEAGAAPHPALADLPRPVVGFAGCVRTARLDLALVAALADQRPAWSFVFAGDVVEDGDESGDWEALAARPNVHHVDLVPREEVGRLVASFDAALLPYRDSLLNRSCFPLKALDALAAGRAVVMTPPRSDLAELGEGFTSAGDPDAVLAALEGAVSSARAPAREAARRAAAEPYRWSRIAARLEAAVEGVLAG